ncbi:NAD(P)-dependent oxidoreductase [Candidatus Enterococcus ferrettii]|uniref:D-3-phosphoglycerate dehydrogenase/2-oxoglutarate reductase n=1 Tax=Candidatus Enterococcus ferrettii TaxID=2815324 RepID=A0ABV0EKF0_9ENTE|nr:NAD(P)-dependent oxidoreductase [Enterococcus sp. 665A]MBO1341583.1 phosphoglycerate dehydrogenase [Enterococcus sp. 665A]
MIKIVVVGDPFVPSENLIKAAQQLDLPQPSEIRAFDWYPGYSREAFRQIVKQIEQEGPNEFLLPAGLVEAMQTTDILLVHIAPVSQTMLQAADNLQLIGTCRGGLEHIDLLEWEKHPNVQLIHVIRNAEPVADFTIGLMYSVVRNIACSYKEVQEGNWPQHFPNDPYKNSLSNLTVGLIGLGHIGKRVVKKLNGLGIPVIAYDAFADQQQLQAAGYHLQLTDIKTVFRQADIVSLHLRVVPETINLIDQQLLQLMKPSSYLINTARPDILNKQDFYDILATKKIAGAGVDVVWEEPILPNDPLLSLDNLIITSHIAGDTIDAIEHSPDLLQQELNHYLQTGNSELSILHKNQ